MSADSGQYTIDFKKSTTAYGRIQVNSAGAEYEVDVPKKEGDLVFAHANSIVYLTVKTQVSIEGGLNRDHQPISNCVYKIDDSILGILDNNQKTTAQKKLEPGNHVLEITAKNNANAHSYWRIISEIPVDNNIIDTAKETPAKKGRRKVQNEN